MDSLVNFQQPHGGETGHGGCPGAPVINDISPTMSPLARTATSRFSPSGMAIETRAAPSSRTNMDFPTSPCWIKAVPAGIIRTLQDEDNVSSWDAVRMFFEDRHLAKGIPHLHRCIAQTAARRHKFHRPDRLRHAVALQCAVQRHRHDGPGDLRLGFFGIGVKAHMQECGVGTKPVDQNLRVALTGKRLALHPRGMPRRAECRLRVPLKNIGLWVLHEQPFGPMRTAVVDHRVGRQGVVRNHQPPPSTRRRKVDRNAMPCTRP